MSKRSTPPPACEAGPATAATVTTMALAVDPLPKLIPYQGISLLSGAPNVGKTALLASLLVAFRDGRPFFGHQPAALPGIGFVNADRGWAAGAGEWFRRVGYPDVRSYSMVDDRTFDPRSLRRKFERTSRLMEFIDKLKLPARSLVIADPIGLFLGGNLLDYDSCACACHELRAALRERQLTLLGAAHTSKLKADKRERYLRLQDQILGSTALLGFTDSSFVLAAPEETGKSYYTFLMHSHLARAEFVFLDRDEQGLFVPYSGADQGNCTRVLALFPEDGAEIATSVLTELAEAIPLSRATLYRVLETLVDRERIEKVKYGVYRRIVLH